MTRLSVHLSRVCLLAVGITLSVGGHALAQEEAATRPDSARTAELEAIFQARRDSARMRFTAADVDFMTGMIHHHAQAVVMSRLAPSHGASPSIQTLAARIINSQLDEIETMETWLQDRGQPVPETGLEENSLAAHGPEQAEQIACEVVEPGEEVGHAEHMEHDAGLAGQMAHAADSTHAAGHLMPGMLTPEQMCELDQAQGPEFDRLFLTYMIQHHSGALTMVDDLFAADGAAQGAATFKLASDIQVDQRTEIARMERMLSALPNAGGAR